jgi:hypothetical protein
LEETLEPRALSEDDDSVWTRDVGWAYGWAFAMAYGWAYAMAYGWAYAKAYGWVWLRDDGWAWLWVVSGKQLE